MVFFILFLSIPIIEIFFFIKISEYIGSLNTISLIILTAISGSILIKKEGIKTLERIRKLSLHEPEKTGILIARIEKIFNFKSNSTTEIDKTNHNYNKKIFRIIEIIPSNIDSWQKNIDDDYNTLLLSVLKWAKLEGCIAADYQFSDLLFNKQLENAGFRSQNAKYEPAECSLAGLFQPYKQKVYPINVAWKLNHKNIIRYKDINGNPYCQQCYTVIGGQI